MISPFNPESDLITVNHIEKELEKLGCEKTKRSTKRGCVWKLPNGKHLTAPNPDTYSMVPPDTLDDLRTIFAALSE